MGALDPHTHKVNQANIQGEGKLEAEGVRPQRQADPIGGLGGGAANTLGTAPALHIHTVASNSNCGMLESYKLPFCWRADDAALMGDAAMLKLDKRSGM